MARQDDGKNDAAMGKQNDDAAIGYQIDFPCSGKNGVGELRFSCGNGVVSQFLSFGPSFVSAFAISLVAGRRVLGRKINEW